MSHYVTYVTDYMLPAYCKLDLVQRKSRVGSTHARRSKRSHLSEFKSIISYMYFIFVRQTMDLLLGWSYFRNDRSIGGD